MFSPSQAVLDVTPDYLHLNWKPTRQEERQSRRISRHTLPLLSIPAQGHTENVSPAVTPDASQSVTPDTPVSLGSPIAGVIDLTSSVRTLNESPITTGGFCDIYRGEWTKKSSDDEKSGETILVAIKLLRVFAIREQEKARKRLNREVYIWHRLEHPNIVKLFGTSYHMSGRPSMVMQWYQNGSATEYLRDCGDAKVDRKSLVLDVGRGLNYLHALTPPIVHGDLKGNNVLITDDGHAVLSDFGLSQVIEALLAVPTGFTPSNPVFGPPRWQAPELLADDACQPGLETDVWGFACTSYEILCGNIPYHHRHRDASVIKDIESGIKPPGPAGLVLSQPDKCLEALLDHCWSFTPSERPTMADVVVELKTLCDTPETKYEFTN